ncbi:MAG TPA: glycosyltransferase family 87 protein, partial [Abditibacterium sp.]
GLEGKKRLVALALVLSFAPVLFAVMQGQVSLLVVLGFFQSFRAAKSGRDFSAGLWLCLLLIRPQMAIAPLLIFAWKGKWRLLAGFMLGAAILGAISLFLVGFEGLASYKTLLGEVSNWKGIYGVQPQQMQTWRGFLHALFGSDEASVIRWPWILGVVAALGALIWSWRGPWRPETPRFERQWAILGLVALFCCPYLYSHDLSLLLVCGFLVFRAAQIEESKLKLLPLVGWAATLAWAILLMASVPIPSLVVLFEAAAILVLARNDFDLKIKLRA